MSVSETEINTIKNPETVICLVNKGTALAFVTWVGDDVQGFEVLLLSEIGTVDAKAPDVVKVKERVGRRELAFPVAPGKGSEVASSILDLLLAGKPAPGGVAIAPPPVVGWGRRALRVAGRSMVGAFALVGVLTAGFLGYTVVEALQDYPPVAVAAQDLAGQGGLNGRAQTGTPSQAPQVDLGAAWLRSQQEQAGNRPFGPGGPSIGGGTGRSLEAFGLQK